MVTPKTLDKYPPEFAGLFNKVRDDSPRPVVITLRSKTEARRLRARLYAFRQALLDDFEHDPELALLAPLVSFRIIASRKLEVSLNVKDNRHDLTAKPQRAIR